MQKRNKNPTQSEPGLGRPPDSRVRIKPQPVERSELVAMVAAKFKEATRDSVAELVAEADRNDWTHEVFVERLLALGLASMKGLISEQDRPHIERVVREILLTDPY